MLDRVSQHDFVLVSSEAFLDVKSKNLIFRSPRLTKKIFYTLFIILKVNTDLEMLFGI